MTWLALRVTLIALAVTLGAWAGQQCAQSPPWHDFGAAIGAATVAALLAAWDAWRGLKLMHWLRVGNQASAPPVLAGWWGEAGQRMARALRLRERETQAGQQQLARMLGAMEASPNGVMLLDAGEHLVWCSRTAALHLGLGIERDHLQRITNLVRAPEFVTLLARPATETSAPALITRADGLRLAITVRAFGGDGQRLVLTQDVTQRERMDQVRRDIVANVSHEIRSPLTVVAGYVEMLGTLELTEAERQQALVAMTEQTRRMQALVTDLLALAGLEGSPPPSRDAWTPLAELGEPVRAEAERLAAGQRVLHIDWGPEGLALAGSATELRSAIANVVTNAVRYTRAGDAVRVQAQVEAGGALVLTVADSGPGIEARHLPRLTERFYRVDPSRSRDSGGTGLGLAIVKQVMQRHDGELRIRSTPGQGSSFTLAWPPGRWRGAVAQSGA